MPPSGVIRIGRKAPDFTCEAIVDGVRTVVSLSTCIQLGKSPSDSHLSSPWLILLFISTTFHYVKPTEVLAFVDRYDEFLERNCHVVVVSVDTKRSLWYWESISRRDGGLGHVKIPLLYDVDGALGRAYGVLLQDDGLDLRGMFILDGGKIVQQITLNHAAVDLSVSEALRLLDAYQKCASLDDPDRWAEELGTYGSCVGGELAIKNDDQLGKSKSGLLRGLCAHVKTRVKLIVATR